MIKDSKLKKSLLFILTISTLMFGSYSVMNKKVLLTVDGKTVKFNTISKTVQSFLINKNIKVEQGSRIIPDLNANIKDNMNIKVINPYEIKISNGVKFAVVLTGNVLTMPGLPRVPAANKIDIDKDGKIEGLF